MKFPIVQHIDARGLRCPLPLLRAKQAFARVGEGEAMEVLATDAGSQRDIPAWVRLAGQTLVSTDQQDAVFRFVIARVAHKINEA